MINLLKLIFITAILILVIYYIKFCNDDNKGEAVTPIVLWHGMGDTCCLPFSLGSFKNSLEKELPGVYVKSIQVGGNTFTDYESGYFIHPDKQIEYVCNELRNDGMLSKGYNAIGFSQGSQFLRAIAQRCDGPKIKVLVSLGGQHQGLFGLPKCPALSSTVCEKIRQMLNTEAYNQNVQQNFVQATYWHDPLNEEVYRNKSTFLSDLNNERNINTMYALKLNELDRFVLVKFLNDTMVQPKESQWFEFYKPGQDKEILPLEQSPVFKRLGLDQMVKNKKLQFEAVYGDHLQIPKEWFSNTLLPLLRN